MLAPNPAKFLYPAYFAYFHSINSLVHVQFITNHPAVQIKGPVSGITEHEHSVITSKQGDSETRKLPTLTLDTSPAALGNFSQVEEGISFSVRFSGQICHVFIPWEAVVAVYCPQVPGLMFRIVYHDPSLAEPQEATALEDQPPVAEVKARPKFGVIQGGKDNES